MSLRLRLFLLMGGLVAVLVLAQWWFVRLLTRELSSELDVVVTSVGKSMVAMFKSSDFDIEKMLPGEALKACSGDDCAEVDLETQLKIVECLVGDCEDGETTREVIRLEGEIRVESDHSVTGTEHGLRLRSESASIKSEVTQQHVVRSSSGPPGRLLIERYRVMSSGDEESVETQEQHSIDSGHKTGPVDPGHRSDPGHSFDDHDHKSSHSYSYVIADEDDSRVRQLVLEQIEADFSEHVDIHVEHKGDDQFLWMGTPSSGHRVRIPRQGFADKLERFSQQLVLGSLGFLALGLLMVAAVSHRVTTPLRQLSGAARQVGTGALGTQVPGHAKGEVGEAIQAFNRMSGRLAELDARARTADADRHLGEIGEIARGLAHTLRNPLNALGLSVEELAAGGTRTADGVHKLDGAHSADDAQMADLAESARRQIRRIDRSIRSFLVLASQSGGVVGDVDVRELIEDVGLEALQDSRGARENGSGVNLDLQVAPDLPSLRGVEPELRAVLQALVVNAVEASPKGGKVTVRAAAVDGPADEAAEKRLRIEIDDEGTGLPAEVRERLFTPHLSTKANGSGMGLFLAHRIANNRYGGQLELVDGETGGTRAVLELGERQAGHS